jgi:hypothetical protein
LGDRGFGKLVPKKDHLHFLGYGQTFQVNPGGIRVKMGELPGVEDYHNVQQYK